MNNIILTIEDLLEITAGMRSNVPQIKINSSDMSIMYSIARQVFKGVPLTDRQYALMQEKLSSYQDQFVDICDFNKAVNTLRTPLRKIDRSKYIKIVSAEEAIGHKQHERPNHEYLKIRFPFSKKSILKLQGITSKRDEYVHHKGTHEHFFLLTEKNVIRLVNSFEGCGFEIADDVIALYNEIKNIDVNNYTIRVENNQLLNMHPNGKKAIEEQLGELNSDNVICYKDRSLLYGISSFDNNAKLDIEKHDILSKNIANRKNNEIHISSKEWTLDRLFNSFFVLKRFPLLILLDENDPYITLATTYHHMCHLIPTEEISVLYRLPNDVSNGYNEFIRDKNLNNPLDKNTKVVYTSKNKVNKPLLQSDCTPVTALMIKNLRTSTQLSSWVQNFDLIVDYSEEPNLVPRFSSNNRWKLYA
jgi:hypothetical protein